MSIHDLIEKINATAKIKPTLVKLQASPDESPKVLEVKANPTVYPNYPKWKLGVAMAALFLGVSGWIGIGILLGKYQQAEPVKIECSQEILHSLEATSTPHGFGFEKGLSKLSSTSSLPKKISKIKLNPVALPYATSTNDTNTIKKVDLGNKIMQEKTKPYKKVKKKSKKPKTSTSVK